MPSLWSALAAQLQARAEGKVVIGAAVGIRGEGRLRAVRIAHREIDGGERTLPTAHVPLAREGVPEGVDTVGHQLLDGGADRALPTPAAVGRGAAAGGPFARVRSLCYRDQ